MRCLKPKKIKEVFPVVIDGRQAGPLNKSELERLVKNGIVTADTFFWTPPPRGLHNGPLRNVCPMLTNYCCSHINLIQGLQLRLKEILEILSARI